MLYANEEGWEADLGSRGVWGEGRAGFSNIPHGGSHVRPWKEMWKSMTYLGNCKQFHLAGSLNFKKWGASWEVSPEKLAGTASLSALNVYRVCSSVHWLLVMKPLHPAVSLSPSQSPACSLAFFYSLFALISLPSYAESSGSPACLRIINLAPLPASTLHSPRGPHWVWPCPLEACGFLELCLVMLVGSTRLSSIFLLCLPFFLVPFALSWLLRNPCSSCLYPCSQESPSLGFCPFLFSGLFPYFSDCFFTGFSSLSASLNVGVGFDSVLTSLSSLGDFPYSYGPNHYLYVDES